MKTLLLLSLVLLPAILSAQETPMLWIRVLCFERDAGGIDRLAVVMPDESVIRMKLPESFPSGKTRVPLTEGGVIFRDPSNMAGPPIALARVPTGLDDALILFFPAPEADDGPVYRTVVVDASLKGIPVDGALVMNVFPRDVRVVLGEHRVLLPPGKSVGLARPKTRNDYNMSPVVFQSQVGGEWKTAAETVVRFPPELQQLFVSYPHSRGERLAIRAYQIDVP